MSEINPGESLPDAIVKGLLADNEKLKSKLNNMEISFEMINNDRTKHLLENKQLKVLNENIEMKNAILGSFKDDCDAFCTMNDVKDFEDLDKQFNNLKKDLEHFKKAFVQAEGERIGHKLNYKKLEQEIKQLKEQNLKLKIDLDEAFGNSAKWKEECNILKQKLEEIEELVNAVGFAETIKEKFKEILEGKE